MSLASSGILETLGEAIGVETDFPCVVDELPARCGTTAVHQEAIVDSPERSAALLDGADHRVTDPFRRCTEVGDVHELEPSDASPEVLFDQERLNLSRNPLAVWSKWIAVLDNQHRRVRVANDVALDDQAISMAAADSLDTGALV